MKKIRKIIKLIALIGIISLLFGRLYSCGSKGNNPISNARMLSASAAEIMPLSSGNDLDISSLPIALTISGNTSPTNSGNWIEFYLKGSTTGTVTYEIIMNEGAENVSYTIGAIASPSWKESSFTKNGNIFYLTTTDSLNIIQMRSDKRQTMPFNLSIFVYPGEYVSGYAQGLQVGYEQGFQAGGEAAKYGIWQNTTVDGIFTYDGDQGEIQISENGMTPNFIIGGIYFNSIWQKYERYNGRTLERADITINFPTPFAYNASYDPIVKTGASDIYDGVFTTSDGKKYAFVFDYASELDGASKIIFSDPQVKNLSNIVSISLSIGRASDLLAEVTLISRSNEYTAGYGVGYNEGLEKGRIEGRHEGYEQGYEQGVQNGYGQATEEGMSGTGIFYGAISMVKLFFQLFTQLMGTKIAGEITIGLIVIGLPAAFMIVDLAISLVRKFFGSSNGGGKDDG